MASYTGRESNQNDIHYAPKLASHAIGGRSQLAGDLASVAIYMEREEFAKEQHLGYSTNR